MPVDPHHVHADVPHASTIDSGTPYGCHNRPPVAPFMAEFQDGRNPDWTPRVVKVLVEFKSGVDCGHVGHDALNKDNDPKCRGCRWSSLK